jgi:cystathionine beta-lyase
MPDPFGVDLETARRRHSLKWRRYPEDVIPLWVAEMDFTVAPVIAERLGGLLDRGDFGYPPEPPEMATSEFREAVAGWMQSRHGWLVDPELVSITPDTMRVLEIAIAQITERGDPVVLTDPVYHPFRTVIEDAGRVPVWVPMSHDGPRWELDLIALAAAFARDEVRLYLHCNPHNPTGTVFTIDEMQAIADLAEEHSVIVVSDEVHADIGYGSRHVPFATVTPTAADRTITASAASKAFNFAGLRCGYAIAGSPALNTSIRSVPMRQRKSISLPGYEATIAAYTGGSAWLEDVNGHLSRMRDHVVDRLVAIDPSLVPSIPAATYLLWTDWRHFELGSDPAAFLLERAKVALSPGQDFGPSGEGFLRLNFGTSLAILDEAIDRIETALDGTGRA